MVEWSGTRNERTDHLTPYSPCSSGDHHVPKRKTLDMIHTTQFRRPEAESNSQIPRFDAPRRSIILLLVTSVAYNLLTAGTTLVSPMSVITQRPLQRPIERHDIVLATEGKRKNFP
ncbi:hypothetical protein J6590_040570 [Homalodisca vitripennis]|nr:hypothetical protein J6590_048324 [Homalodisca vitripennis]KAG8272412.1 hypothetical protein J6590_040570 [Homalodisca vitripennis]